MSCTPSKFSSKVVVCDRFNKHLCASQRIKSEVVRRRPQLVKKLVLSKTVNSTKDGKCCSTGIITSPKTSYAKPKKVTKSECTLEPNQSQAHIHYCDKCGDCEPPEKTGKLKTNDIKNIVTLNKILRPNKLNHNPSNGLQQHYINTKFQQSSESIADNIPKKNSLEPIKEQSESCSKDTIFRIYDDSDDDNDFHSEDGIGNIKKFRSQNFFECHSVKSRFDNRCGKDKHQCIYRFYLNERLYPVPFNADFNENIRCMECNLPLKNKQDLSLNGVIQTKVKLNDEVQDMLVMLPVKNNLIIKERKKKRANKKDLDSVYFGIIKLNMNGDSIFNRTLPDDSLALRYQKGYRKFANDFKYTFTNSADDVVII